MEPIVHKTLEEQQCLGNFTKSVILTLYIFNKMYSVANTM